MYYPALFRLIASSFLCGCALFLESSFVLAQPGTLDPSFDQDGYVEQWFPSGGDGEALWATAIQPDGKIIVVGGSERWRVSRFNSDGSLDTSFNRTGSVIPEITNYWSAARSVALQADGKIVVAGFANSLSFTIPNSNNPFRVSIRSLIVRYNSDGSIDSAFGDNGVATIMNGDYNSHEVSSLSISPNGKILAVGSLRTLGHTQIAIWRINNDGSPDAAFGNAGIVTTDIGSESTAKAVAHANDGKIVVGGCSQTSPYETDFAVLRYNEDGSLDLGFNATGYAGLQNLAGNDCVTDLILPGDGTIIVGGNFATQGGGNTYTIAKYSHDGPFDYSFNGYGAVPFASSPISRMIQQFDGKIVVSGSAYGGPGQPTGLLTRRYHPNGTVDTTFGTLGQVFTLLPVSNSAYSAFAKAAALQPDGKIIVVVNAGAMLGSARIARIVRYDANGSPDSTFDSGGVVNLEVDSSLSTAKSTFALPNGRILAAGGLGIMRFMPDGRLDRTYGTSGKVCVNLPGTSDAINAAALQPDQKILVASSRRTQPNIPNRPIFVGRYNADGSKDTTFGTAGEIVLTAGTSLESARAIAVQDDGKILMLATGYQNDVPRVLMLRLDQFGNLDTTFSDDGIVAAFVGPLSDAGAITIQPDGKILVVVRKAFSEAAVLRYNSDGSNDITFGEFGNVSIPRLVGNSLALQADGKIVVGGTVRPPNAQSEIGVARLNPDGSLDVSFGDNGIALSHITDYDDEGNAIRIQTDGRIVVAGSAYLLPPSSNGEGRSDFTVVRYNTDGSPDQSWGQSGIAVADLLGGDSAFGMDIDSHGRIVVSGESRRLFSISRLLGDSTPQTVFSVSGRVTDPANRGVAAATVTITDSQGETRRVITSNFGYFTLDGLPEDEYVVGVRSRRFRFATQHIAISTNVTDVVLTGLE